MSVNHEPITLDLTIIRANLAFMASDPLRYGATITGSATTNQTVTNAGDSTTDRATITIIGNGSAPLITNTTDGNGYVQWSSNVTGGDTRIIDLRARTVVDGSGNDKRSELLNASTFFSIRSGGNSVTVGGCTSAQFSHRPAWN